MRPLTDHRPASSLTRLVAAAALTAAALLVSARPASAQLDPLLFLQRSQPNVIIAVDVSDRMQWDANGNYFDPYDYPRTGAACGGHARGPGRAQPTYRRMYQVAGQAAARQFGRLRPPTFIQTMGSNNPLYSAFWSRTRLAVARAGLLSAVREQRQRRPVRPPEDAPDEPAHRRTARTTARFTCCRQAQQNPTPSRRERRALAHHDDRRRRAERGGGLAGRAPGRCLTRRGRARRLRRYLSRAVNQPGGADSGGAGHRHRRRCSPRLADRRCANGGGAPDCRRLAVPQHRRHSRRRRRRRERRSPARIPRRGRPRS